MQTKTGRKPKYQERMTLFFMRLPKEQIRELKQLAQKKGYTDKASGGVSGFARDLLLASLKAQ